MPDVDIQNELAVIDTDDGWTVITLHGQEICKFNRLANMRLTNVHWSAEEVELVLIHYKYFLPA